MSRTIEKNHMTERLEQLHAAVNAARTEVHKVILGQNEALDAALTVILTRQHALIEGVPGVAKTLLARTLAHVLGCEFARIQFTPDLMPADITGTNVFNFERNQFTLVRGPVFTSFLLADEINRAPAKTQSALLEAMQERTVTIDRETHALSESFTVFATQNPIEYEGTYPLPEAQKDRFLLKVPMSAPEREDELELARRMLGSNAPEDRLKRGDVQAVLQPGELERARAALTDVSMRDEIAAYIVDIARRTRTHESVLVGAGPRATQGLVVSSRAHAALAGRDFVTPDDVKAMAVPVLEHRLILRPEFEIEGMTPAETVMKILESVVVPV
jgi:MoxR-like ATPase